MLTTLQKRGDWSEGTNVRGWIHSTIWDSQNSELMNIAQRTHQLFVTWKEVREATVYQKKKRKKRKKKEATKYIILVI